MSAIFSATIEQCTSNALKRTKFGCILLGFTKLRLAGNGGPLPLVLIKAPAKIEPINGLRCAAPLLSERESAARARSVYTHHEPKFGAAPRFRDFDKKHPKRRDLGGTSRGPLINRKDNGFSELD